MKQPEGKGITEAAAELRHLHSSMLLLPCPHGSAGPSLVTLGPAKLKSHIAEYTFSQIPIAVP